MLPGYGANESSSDSQHEYDVLVGFFFVGKRNFSAPPPARQVSRSRAASAVMRYLEKHRVAVVAAAEREDCQKAPDAVSPEVGGSDLQRRFTGCHRLRAGKYGWGEGRRCFCFTRVRSSLAVDHPL